MWYIFTSIEHMVSSHCFGMLMSCIAPNHVLCTDFPTKRVQTEHLSIIKFVENEYSAFLIPFGYHYTYSSVESGIAEVVAIVECN